MDGWKWPGVLKLDEIAFVHVAVVEWRILMVNVIELNDLPTLVDLIEQHVILCLMMVRRQERPIVLVQEIVDLNQLLLLMLVLVGQVKLR